MKSGMLYLESVSGGYDRACVVHDITLSIHAGTFTGVIGPNGCGKSTLVRLMTGTLTPFSGRVLFNGSELTGIDRKELCRSIACVSRDAAPGFAFTVQDVALMGRMPYLGRFQNETAEDLAIVERALMSTDTFQLRHKTIDRLSSGELQRVSIARALAQEPALLILDEPTAHLDIGHQIAVLDLLRSFNRERDLTVVTVLHDLNMAAQYCERLLVMDRGRVIAAGTPDEVLTADRLEAIYRTPVVIHRSPVSSRPCIFPVPGQNENQKY